MIKEVRAGKEIVVVSQNKVGILSKIAKALAERGINVLAISAQAAGGVGLINLVAEDHLRASDLLRKKGFPVQENGVVLVEVEDRPGVLRQFTQKLAAKKIDILNIYGSASAGYGPCLLVLSTSDNQKATVTLRQAAR